MIDYQHFTNFSLTDIRTGKTKNLTEDFGGIIINTNETFYERECMPQQNFITDKNNTRDGEIFIKSTYGVRTLDMTCLFSEELGGGDLFELKQCLGKKYQQIFEWENESNNLGIYVIENGGWKSQVYYQRQFYGQIELKFIAHNPYYFIKNERDITFSGLNIGDSKNIKCRGNCDSYPLLKITPTSTLISFKWNDLTVTLSNLTIGQTYYLNCELCQCYYFNNNIKVLSGNNYQSNQYIDYPKIDCEMQNTLNMISGTVSSFVIQLNSRII